MTLKELKTALAGGAQLEAMVLAVDPMVYLLQVQRLADTAGLPATLEDSHGKQLVYRSRYAADQAFARAGVDRVTLIHNSAYGEMVGLSQGDNTMRQSYPVADDTV